MEAYINFVNWIDNEKCIYLLSYKLSTRDNDKQTQYLLYIVKTCIHVAPQWLIAKTLQVGTMHDMQYKLRGRYCLWGHSHLFHIMAMLDWTNV